MIQRIRKKKESEKRTSLLKKVKNLHNDGYISIKLEIITPKHTPLDWKTTYLNAKVEISAQKQNFSMKILALKIYALIFFLGELMKSGPTTLFRTVDDKDKNSNTIFNNLRKVHCL